MNRRHAKLSDWLILFAAFAILTVAVVCAARMIW